MWTRASLAPRALANIHAPIRSGTDIAFLGGIIHHILENDLWFRDFVLAYTNIAPIIEDGYQDPEKTGGVFSGFNADTGSYKQDTWQYKGKIVPAPISEHRVQTQDKVRGRRLRGDDGGSAAGRSDAAAPGLRLPDHAAPLCALHARDGGARDRLSA